MPPPSPLPPAVPSPPAVPPPPLALPPSRPGPLEEIRYLAFGRVVPAVIFAFLGYLNMQHLSEQIRALGSSPSLYNILVGPVQRGLYLLFVAIPVLIYVGRPRPRARDGSLIARIAAFVGTTMLLIFGAYFDGGQRLVEFPSWLHAVDSLLLVAATALGVYGILYLRLSFSIIPEARRLVRGGPYHIVRHPLYAAEIGTAISLVIQGDLRVWSTLIIIPFVAIQLLRTRYEERLLRANFPEYDDYARQTARLVPFVF